MEVYSADVEWKMKRFFGWLSEKDRRRYAAVEAAKLGHGGVEYLARVLACDPKTIRQGLRDLEEEEDAAAGRIRKTGGGRPQRAIAQPTLEANLRQLLQEFTAGDPMREGVLWTNLSLRELSRRLLALGTPASRRTIRRLLRKLTLGRRTARKKKTMGHHPDRNAQCENIARLRREYEAAGDAVISIDTKKKE
jgi:Rhodopirellula transposase DDE domain